MLLLPFRLVMQSKVDGKAFSTVLFSGHPQQQSCTGDAAHVLRSISSEAPFDEYRAIHCGDTPEIHRQPRKASVLVQREMENWRSPLASIPPSSAGQLGEHRATQVATGELGGG